MKLNFKNVFLSVGIFVFALGVFGLVSTSKAEAANTCTAVSDGDWHTVSRWSGCGGVLPTSVDAVVIPDNFELTMSGDASVASLTFGSAATTANGLALNGHTLTVAGDVTLVASTGAATTLAVGTGTLTLTSGGDISITGDGTNDSAVTVSTGTINVDTIVMLGTAAHAKLTSTGASNINIGGNITGGTLDDTGGTITFTGAGAHNPGAYTTYNNVAITGGGTVTVAATTTFGGTLTITSGTLDTGNQIFTVGGVSSITGTILLGTALKTFTGNVTLNAGAVWTESGASTYVFGGDFTNNATTFTANSGLHTFNGASTKVISGSTTTSIANVTIATGNHTNSGTLTVAGVLTVTGVTLTNNGTITATASLTGTGTLVQGAAGVLNIGDAIDIAHLNAVTAGNTVNYTKSNTQTVFDPDTGTVHAYSNLGLSGTSAKTITAATVIGQTLTIGGTASASLTGDSNTANKLIIGSAVKSAGTWGSTTSTATHTSDTYFASTGKITVATGGSAGTRIGETITYTPPTTTTTTTTTTVETTTTTPVVTPVAEVVPGCSGGNVFNTSTGKPCSNNTEVTSKKVYALGQTTLKNGSKGEAVKELQRFLNDKLSLGLVVDGKLGLKTIAVIKKWQKDNGLVADGLIGAKTKAMMNK